MKLPQLSIKVFLSLISILFVADPARSQIRNMSDITLPSPDAMIADPPSDDIGIGDNLSPGEEPTVVDGEVPVVEDGVVNEAPSEDNLSPGEEPTAVDGEVSVEDGVVNEAPSEDNSSPVEEPTVVDGEVSVEDGVVNEAPSEDNSIPVEEPTVVDGEVSVEDGVANEVPSEDNSSPVEEPTAVDNQTPSEEADGAVNLRENTAGDSTTVVEENTNVDLIEDSSANTSNTTVQDSDIEDTGASDLATSEETPNVDVEETSAEVNNVDNIDSQPVEAESTISEQDETFTADIETPEESLKVEESVKSEEIIEEIVEEVELRDAQDTSKAEEEVAQEEVAQEELENEEEVAEEPSQEEEAATEEKKSEPDLGQLDRVAYETQFQEAPNDLAIQMQEEFQLTQLIDSSGLELYGSVPSVKDISRRLAQLAEQTGKKSAFINISLQSNQLESFVVLPEQAQANADGSVVATTDLNAINSTQKGESILRKTVKDTSREDIIATATQFREQISDVRQLGQSDYKLSAQKLYDILIKPIEADLEANDIDVLVFSMDSGLRLLPVAALHDGEQFLIEKYALGMVPSFGLTDTRYVSSEQSTILAMGASEFEEQAALPTMPIELKTIVSNPRHGESFLNEQFTIPNFVAQNSRETPFSIIHLGTHAEFKAGDLNNSYIQFYDDKLKIPQLQELSDRLGWNTNASPIELLVLSACETAIGDREAEMGFAGLAVQAGVKSALASLWYVSDLGTLALMGEFYDRLGDTSIKAEALRQTQLEMLQGNVKIDNRQVKLSNGVDLPLPEDFPEGTLSLDHPYFWSSFTLIGNWN